MKLKGEELSIGDRIVYSGVLNWQRELKVEKVSEKLILATDVFGQEIKLTEDDLEFYRRSNE